MIPGRFGRAPGLRPRALPLRVDLSGRVTPHSRTPAVPSPALSGWTGDGTAGISRKGPNAMTWPDSGDGPGAVELRPAH
jgi:hypothetical protein